MDIELGKDGGEWVGGYTGGGSGVSSYDLGDIPNDLNVLIIMPYLKASHTLKAMAVMTHLTMVNPVV